MDLGSFQLGGGYIGQALGTALRRYSDFLNVSFSITRERSLRLLLASGAIGCGGHSGRMECGLIPEKGDIDAF